ncbi:hypothetical protein KP77_17330 [Jeotgalibacillus alimentarius]|uniref:Copper amine oxidase-like N-terminal domain-containing protein n=1 Tax=Jeotgalibacillus alimentarius TaxID=135826 RepID=A0A0C2W2N7_9BACL|nr:hypothetical protein [Jeotgalibacillus alimentarius]KIL50358.1 hypothetical protein KP77_17330 [Jeotgalibacillus alimentarius]
MKWVLSFFTLLLMTAAAGLLYFQWTGYDSAAASDEKVLVSQTLDVKIKPRGITVSQTINGLPDTELLIDWPEIADPVSCMEECGRVSKNMDKVIAGEKTSVTLTYTLQTPVTPALLKNWGAKLRGTEVQSTSVHLTESYQSEGMWISSLPFNGNSQLELIRFSSYSHQGNEGELIWVSGQLYPVSAGPGQTVFSPSEALPDITLSEYAADVPFTAVVTDTFTPEDSNDFIIINNLNDSDAMTKLINEYAMKKSYGLSGESQFVVDYVMLQLLNEETDSEKTLRADQSVKSVLSKSKLTEWEQWLHEKRSSLTAADLDQKLSDLMKGKTAFFELNAATDGYIPLSITDSREVTLNGELLEGAHRIDSENESYYTLLPLLEHLGYTVQDAAGSVTAIGDSSYTFYPDEAIFRYNGSGYDLMSPPVISINNQLYIQERWVQKFLLLSVEKDQQIHLTK